MSSSVPSTMKAILVPKPGGPSNIEYGDAPVPKVGAKELLIRVEGTACNRADTLQREGKYPPPPGATTIMGLECVGTVADLGAEVKSFKKGDRVMALLAGGGYAQYCTVDEGSAMPIPDHLDMEKASALPEVYLTSYLIARQLGGLKEGDVVLIHAGAAGVGTALIQLCTLFGARSIVTVGSEEKAEFCKKLGAAHAINYKKQKDWGKAVVEFCGTLSPPAKGVSLLLDPVGASHALQNLEALAEDGRWILYGTMGGAEVDKFPIGAILRKRIKLQGSTLRARSLQFKAELVHNLQKECLAAFADGKLKPIIDCSFPLKDMAKAHEHMEKDANIGKIIIKVEH